MVRYSRSEQNLPGSSSVASLKNGIDRSEAPASPTTGGPAPYATFKQTIFKPPEGHPVYKCVSILDNATFVCESFLRVKINVGK